MLSLNTLDNRSHLNSKNVEIYVNISIDIDIIGGRYIPAPLLTGEIEMMEVFA